MKTLVIYAHPNHLGHHGYFLEKIIEIITKEKIDYEVIDLYLSNYDPILKNEELGSGENRQISEVSKSYQEKITEADKLIFIFPTWWQNMPAIMKGFFDRVFSAKFAFKYASNGLPVGLLKGKKAAVFSATGGPRWVNKILFGDRGMDVVIKNTLNFCGIKAKGFSIGSAVKFNDDRKKQIDGMAVKIFKYLYK